jgi:signal transduction histidine kinase
VVRILDEASRLRAANEQLQSLDRLRDDFMSSVTHELRTPLTSIRALAELMADDPGMATAQRQAFIAIIVAETERLSRLVNQVLDLAKIEAGHADWHHGRVDLAALVRQAAATMAGPLREQGTVLTLDLAEPAPPLRGDADRLTQVLLNLLGNAAKFVPRPGGVISVTLAHDAAGFTLRVQDNGPGVPLAEHAHIFDKFHQGGDAAHRPGGTGLGLPISRRIVAHHGGTIALREDGAQGACFEVRLPIKAPDPLNPSTGDLR